jgi:hypothetical protein
MPARATTEPLRANLSIYERASPCLCPRCPRTYGGAPFLLTRVRAYSMDSGGIGGTYGATLAKSAGRLEATHVFQCPNTSHQENRRSRK